MSLDEDTFVIIVGDDDYEIPDELKDVVKDREVTNLIIEEEPEINNYDVNETPLNEFLYFKDEAVDVYEEEIDDNDEEYIPKEEETSSDDDISDEERSNNRKKKYSYVLELRQAYPELRNDNKMLIDILAQIMNALKPPPLPQDYFLMNGIMSECVKCGKLSNGIPEAARHYQEYHGERYLICFACGADFRSTTNLYKHEKSCTAPDIGIVLKARARQMGLKTRSRPNIEHRKLKQRHLH